MKTPKPEPVPTNTICSVCGESWASHIPEKNGDVSVLECIRLLKLRAVRPSYVPYPVYPTYPTWTYTTSGTSTIGKATNTITLQ